MQIVGTSSVYPPRQPQQSPLWQLIYEHFHDFELNFDARCVRRYGYLRRRQARRGRMARRRRTPRKSEFLSISTCQQLNQP